MFLSLLPYRWHQACFFKVPIRLVLHLHISRFYGHAHMGLQFARSHQILVVLVAHVRSNSWYFYYNNGNMQYKNNTCSLVALQMSMCAVCHNTNIGQQTLSQFDSYTLPNSVAPTTPPKTVLLWQPYKYTTRSAQLYQYSCQIERLRTYIETM